MKIYENVLIPSNLNIAGGVLGIGYFDGLHLGHQQLIKKMKETNKPYAILSFSNNLKKGPYLLTKAEKEDKLNSLGVSSYYVLDFNEKIKNLSKDDFIRFLMENKLDSIYVGEDFTFGRNKEGKAKDLFNIPNIKVNVVKLLKKDGKKISSSYIKELLLGGQIEKANKLLGYNYSITSNIIHGFGRGEKLGFETMNLEIRDDKILPKNGVYQSYVLSNNDRYLSMTNIGYAPTFRNNKLSIETHSINKHIELKVNYITLEFNHYIREEIAFPNEKELSEQIANDKITAINLSKK